MFCKKKKKQDKEIQLTFPKTEDQKLCFVVIKMTCPPFIACNFVIVPGKILGFACYITQN